MTAGQWLPSVGWIDISNRLSPYLRRTRAGPSLWNNVKPDSSLKTQFLQIVRSLPHTAASPVIQNQSGTPGARPRPINSNQKPVYNAPNWQSPPKLGDHLHAQTRSRDEKIVPDYSYQLYVFLGRGQDPPTSTPPRMWLTRVSVASQNFADTSVWHTQHSCHFSLRLAYRTSSCSWKLRGMMPSKNDRTCKLMWQETHSV